MSAGLLTPVFCLSRIPRNNKYIFSGFRSGPSSGALRGGRERCFPSVRSLLDWLDRFNQRQVLAARGPQPLIALCFEIGVAPWLDSRSRPADSPSIIIVGWAPGHSARGKRRRGSQGGSSEQRRGEIAASPIMQQARERRTDHLPKTEGGSHQRKISARIAE